MEKMFFFRLIAKPHSSGKMITWRQADGIWAFRILDCVVGSLAQWPKKEPLTLEGGDLSVLDPCEPMSYHGFLGLDGEVVTAIASWIKQF